MIARESLSWSSQGHLISNSSVDSKVKPHGGSSIATGYLDATMHAFVPVENTNKEKKTTLHLALVLEETSAERHRVQNADVICGYADFFFFWDEYITTPVYFFLVMKS